jgi:uncharacterized protein
MIELPGLAPHEVATLVPHRPILISYRGSRAHGMYVPPEEPTSIDDIDIHVIYIPGLEHYFGPDVYPPKGKDIKLKEWDCAAYEVRHLVSLLCKANPNVLSLLWTEAIIFESKEGEMLRKARNLFVTKQAFHSFGGYAKSQLHKMTSFGEGSFTTGYMGAKRKGLVEQFGYDTKNAAHLIRLLAMGAEFLRNGELVVDRRAAGDADSLLAIKRGEWKLEEVQALAKGMYEAMETAYNNSPLPEDVDYRKVTDMLMDIMCIATATMIALRQRDVLLGGLPPLGKPHPLIGG